MVDTWDSAVACATVGDSPCGHDEGIPRDQGRSGDQAKLRHLRDAGSRSFQDSDNHKTFGRIDLGGRSWVGNFRCNSRPLWSMCSAVLAHLLVDAPQNEKPMISCPTNIMKHGIHAATDKISQEY